MIKILLKKQLSEIFRGYLYNQKKNKARSKAAVAAYIVMFVILMVVVLGGLFTFLAVSLCGPIAAAGADWLYFSIVGLIAIALGAFGSVFNTYSGLYLSKDNDLLLSMPIMPSTIMVSRLLGVYLMGLMYSGIVMIPAVIVYLAVVSFSIKSIIGGILLTFLVSVFVLTLSAALGWVVAKISLKLKNKSFIAVLASLVFVALYYVVYFKAQEIISDLTANALMYGDKIKDTAYPLYMFGKAGTGDAVALLIVAAVVAVLFAAMWKLLSGSFMKIATAVPGGKKKQYKSGKMQKGSIKSALLKKEFARFTGSPSYMLNCGFGILLLPVFGVFMIIKGREMFGIFTEALGLGNDAVLYLAAAIVCFISTMNDMAAPSVSLEGKSLWILQSAPISPWQAIKAKILLQIILTGVPATLCMFCLLAAFPFSAVQFVLSLMIVLSCTVFLSLLSLFFGLKFPNTNWTSEIIPVKQGAAVMLSLLLGFVFAAAVGVGGFILTVMCKFTFELTACLAVAFTAALSLVLYFWLKKRGSEIFAAL